MQEIKLKCLSIKGILTTCNISKNVLIDNAKRLNSGEYKIEELDETEIYSKFIESKRMSNGEQFSILVDSLKEFKDILNNKSLKELI